VIRHHKKPLFGGIKVIRTELTKFSGSGARAFLAVVAAMSLYLLAAHPILARAASDLPLQIGFPRGGTALYITPEVGVDPTAGQDTSLTPPGSPAIRNIFVFTTQGNANLDGPAQISISIAGYAAGPQPRAALAESATARTAIEPPRKVEPDVITTGREIASG
jgi:hypothetical protein